MWYYTLTWQKDLFYILVLDKIYSTLHFFKSSLENVILSNQKCLLPFPLLTIGILQPKSVQIHPCTLTQRRTVSHRNSASHSKKKKSTRSDVLIVWKQPLTFLPALGLILPAQASALVSVFCFTFKALQKLQKLCWKNHLTFIQSMRTFSPPASGDDFFFSLLFFWVKRESKKWTFELSAIANDNSYNKMQTFAQDRTGTFLLCAFSVLMTVVCMGFTVMQIFIRILTNFHKILG